MDELAVFGIERLMPALLPLPFPYRTEPVGPVDVGDQWTDHRRALINDQPERLLVVRGGLDVLAAHRFAGRVRSTSRNDGNQFEIPEFPVPAPQAVIVGQRLVEHPAGEAACATGDGFERIAGMDVAEGEKLPDFLPDARQQAAAPHEKNPLELLLAHTGAIARLIEGAVERADDVLVETVPAGLPFFLEHLLQGVGSEGDLDATAGNVVIARERRRFAAAGDGYFRPLNRFEQ